MRLWLVLSFTLFSKPASSSSSRPTFKNLPGSEPDVTYGYDLLGRLTSASQTGNALSFTYDALGRKLTETGPQGTASSLYDLAGRRTRLTFPGTGLFVDYDYSVAGEVTAIRENGATSGVGLLASYAYDDLGRRTGITFGNGTSASYSFDAVSRLTSLTQNLAGTVNDLTIGSIGYNPASQITTQNRSNDAYATAPGAAGTTSSVTNGLNQLATVGGGAVTHDVRGNLTAWGTKSFTYSSENLLLTGPNSSTLGYDPLLRLHQVMSGSTARFAYDGLDRIAEYDGSNNLLRRYVHGPGVDEPIVWYEGSGTTDRRWLHADERGSIVAVSNASGTSIGTNRFDEYGIPGPGNIGAFGYTGQAWLPSLGVHYYKARMFDPELGRFLQPDPIGHYGGPNWYAYVLNDPVNFRDPLGLDADCESEAAAHTAAGSIPPLCVDIVGGQGPLFPPPSSTKLSDSVVLSWTVMSGFSAPTFTAAASRPPLGPNQTWVSAPVPSPPGQAPSIICGPVNSFTTAGDKLMTAGLYTQAAGGGVQVLGAGAVLFGAASIQPEIAFGGVVAIFVGGAFVEFGSGLQATGIGLSLLGGNTMPAIINALSHKAIGLTGMQHSNLGEFALSSSADQFVTGYC